MPRPRAYPRIVAVDFDGTIAKHEYPGIGAECPGALDVLKWMVREKHARIILYTMRSGDELDAALSWLAARGVVPWSVNANPEQSDWTASPKPYAHIYIDDAALGVPLVHPEEQRSHVCWTSVRAMLEVRWALTS